MDFIKGSSKERNINMIQNPIYPKPECSAVKIEINNPTVTSRPTTCPQGYPNTSYIQQPYYFAYPQSSVYANNNIPSYPVQTFVPIHQHVQERKDVQAMPVSNVDVCDGKVNNGIEKTVKTTTVTKTETNAIPTGYVATIPVYQTYPSSNGEIKLQSVPQPVVTEPAQKKNIAESISEKTIIVPSEPEAVNNAKGSEVISKPKEEPVVIIPAKTVIVEEKKTEETVTKAPVVENKEIQPVISKPEIVPADKITPKISIDKYCDNLAVDDFEAQYKAMKTIKDMVKKYPQDSTATSLVDIRVYDKLYDILTYDTSKLAGPAPEQVMAREKIAKGVKVSPKEKEVAESLSPKEYAEYNKSIAMFTMAALDKLMIDVLKNEDNINIPLVDIPYANAIADEAKDNPNPLVRASAIESLSWIQQPEYKNELKTVFMAAANDKDSRVSGVAKNAMNRLNELQ